MSPIRDESRLLGHRNRPRASSGSAILEPSTGMSMPNIVNGSTSTPIGRLSPRNLENRRNPSLLGKQQISGRAAGAESHSDFPMFNCYRSECRPIGDNLRAYRNVGGVNSMGAQTKAIGAFADALTLIAVLSRILPSAFRAMTRSLPVHSTRDDERTRTVRRR